MSTHSLLPHPLTPADFVGGLEAGAAADSGVLRLHYALRGDPRRMRVPAPGAAGRTDRLWAHTCFEAFVRVEDAPGYLELNFSPSGQWAAYRFDAYRQGMTPLALEEPPRIAARFDGHSAADAAPPAGADSDEESGAARAGEGSPNHVLTLEALARLPGYAGAKGRKLRLGLCAVVEDETGGLSYWALRHADGRPDFHRPEAFALELTCL